nr:MULTISPECIES: hypothetical protein [unclassified Streptomyces]
MIGYRVRDVASGGEGELMAVTHEVHDHGRAVAVAHIRSVSGVEWSTALGNVRPSSAPVSATAPLSAVLHAVNCTTRTVPQRPAPRS